MAYKSKTGLNPTILTKNGQDSIEFIEFNCKYENDDIVYITSYYNPLTGLYDINKTQIYFQNSILLINQSYELTEAELT